MRLSIERVYFIGMQMLCHEELVEVFKNHVKIGRRLSAWLGRHVAVQTDHLLVQSEGFMTEQTEIPLDEQGETEFLSANTEHSPPRQPDSKCVTIQLELSWTREDLDGQQREDTSLKVVARFKEARMGFEAKVERCFSL